MERIVNLQIEKLPEGVYLATSDNIQGLLVQGNSIVETIEIARDVAKNSLKHKSKHKQEIINILHINKNYGKRKRK